MYFSFTPHIDGMLIHSNRVSSLFGVFWVNTNTNPQQSDDGVCSDSCSQPFFSKANSIKTLGHGKSPGLHLL